VAKIFSTKRHGRASGLHRQALTYAKNSVTAVTIVKKRRVLPKHRAALISDSMAFSQAPGKAAGPWTRDNVCRTVWLFTSSAYTDIKLYCP